MIGRRHRIVPSSVSALLALMMLTPAGPLKAQELQFTSETAWVNSPTSGLDVVQAANPVLSDSGQHMIFTNTRPSGQSYPAYISELWYMNRETGVSELLSEYVGTVGAVTPDGRYVLFEADSAYLLEGAPYGWQSFIYDRTTDTTTWVSQGQQWSVTPGNCLTADARYVVFFTHDPLSSNDTNGDTDVYMKDLVEGSTECLSVDENGTPVGGAQAAMTGDGRFVAYTTEASLVPEDANGIADIYLLDTSTGVHELVSGPANTQYWPYPVTRCPDISDDGRFVTFSSGRPDLVSGDTNEAEDVFLWDRTTSTMERVSVASDGSQGQPSPAGPYEYLQPNPRVSSDGAVVSFQSLLVGLAPGDPADLPDLFVRDRAAGRTLRVNRASDGSYASVLYHGSHSSTVDGAMVAFCSTDAITPEDMDAGLLDVYCADWRLMPFDQEYQVDYLPSGRAVAFDVSCGGSPVAAARITMVPVDEPLQTELTSSDGGALFENIDWPGASWTVEVDGQVVASGVFEEQTESQQLRSAIERLRDEAVRKVRLDTVLTALEWSLAQEMGQTIGYDDTLQNMLTVQIAADLLGDDYSDFDTYAKKGADKALKYYGEHNKAGLLCGMWLAMDLANASNTWDDKQLVGKMQQVLREWGYEDSSAHKAYLEDLLTIERGLWGTSEAEADIVEACDQLLAELPDVLPASAADELLTTIINREADVLWESRRTNPPMLEWYDGSGAYHSEYPATGRHMRLITDLKGDIAFSSAVEQPMWINCGATASIGGAATAGVTVFGTASLLGVDTKTAAKWSGDVASGMFGTGFAESRGEYDFSGAISAAESLYASIYPMQNALATDTSITRRAVLDTCDFVAAQLSDSQAFQVSMATEQESASASATMSLDTTATELAGPYDWGTVEASALFESTSDVAARIGGHWQLLGYRDGSSVSLASSAVTETALPSHASVETTFAADVAGCARAGYDGYDLVFYPYLIDPVSSVRTELEPLIERAGVGTAAQRSVWDTYTRSFVETSSVSDAQSVVETFTVPADTSARIVLAYPAGTEFELHLHDEFGGHVGSQETTDAVEYAIDGVQGELTGSINYLDIASRATEATYAVEVFASQVPEPSDFACYVERRPEASAIPGLFSDGLVASVGPSRTATLSVGLSELSGGADITNAQVFASDLIGPSGTIAVSSFDFSEATQTVRAGSTAMLSGVLNVADSVLDGSYAGTLTVDAAGTSLSVATTVTVDTAAPSAPLLDTLPAVVGSIPEVTGSAEPGCLVHLYSDATLIGATFADAAGVFGINSPLLEEGLNPLVAIAEDSAGNSSLPSDARLVVLDTEPPTGTMSLSEGATYSDATITIDSDVDGATQMQFFASRDGVDWGDGPGWIDYQDSLEVMVGAGGTWHYKVEYRDEADNRMTLVDDVIADLDAPQTTCDAVSTYVDEAIIIVSASDAGGSGVGATYYKLDGTQQTYSGPITVAQVGTHTLEYWSADAVGNEELPHHTAMFEVVASIPDLPDGTFEVAGENRYTTAIAASKRAYPDGAATVVIATGANWPDALGGAALAGVVEGPLLLTTTNALPDAVLAEVKRLEATDAYILGGTGAVSTAVENTLKANLTGDITRLAGANRYGTANAVADEVIALSQASADGFAGDAFIATGANFPDALGASPLAASSGTPILLAPTGGTPYLPDAVDSAVILGGTGAVTSATESAVMTALGDANVTRVGGTDRYDTAALVADYGVASGMRWDGVGIATGAAFPDALSGGAMLGSFDSVLLLTRPTSLVPVAEQRLAANKDSIDTVFFIGGTGAVSQSVRDKVEQVLD